MKTFFLRSFFYVFLLLLWIVLYHLKIWPDYLFPSLQSVVEFLKESLKDGSLLANVSKSFYRLSIGYILSVGVGVFLGILMYRLKFLEETLGSLLLGLQTLPSICWVPLSLLWFGLNDNAIIFVIVMGSVLGMSLATMQSLKQVPVILFHAGQTLGARRSTLYLNVLLPAAFPGLVEGMKNAWTFAWRSLMGAELLFVTTGLGHLLSVGRELNDMSQVLGVMFVIIAIGVVIDRIVFAKIESYIAERWGHRE